MEQPTPDHPQGEKEISPAAFKAAYEIAKVLQNLSKKDQKSAMQMAGVQAGLSVTSQFAAVATAVANRAPAPAPQGPKPRRQPPPQKKWGADVKAKQSEIARLNKQISEESARLGASLPAGHALLELRDQSFRELKALKGASGASQ